MKVSNRNKFCARFQLFFGIGEVSRRKAARLKRLDRMSYDYAPWRDLGTSREQYLDVMKAWEEQEQREQNKRRREREHQDNVAELVRLLKKS